VLLATANRSARATRGDDWNFEKSISAFEAARTGFSADNSAMESFFSLLKTERTARKNCGLLEPSSDSKHYEEFM
jgi:hypothetical protein